MAKRKPRVRSSFRFGMNDIVQIQNPSVDQVLEAVRKRQEAVSFEPLEGKSIDPTGMIEQNGAHFSNYGFSRLCSALEIPRRFVDDISSYNPELAAQVVNEIVQRRSSSLLLAKDGDVIEGVVSGGYSRLENSAVAEIVADVTDSDTFSSLRLEGLRMRLNHVPDKEDMREKVKPGMIQQNDVLGSGIDVYNGEDGGTAFQIRSYLFRLLCSNGMIGPDPKGPGGKGTRLAHRGSALREKAMLAVQRSQEIVRAYMDKMPLAANIILNPLEQKDLLDRVSRNFSVAFANRVIDKAAEEAQGEGHDDAITLYNLFNGVTFQAHGTRSLDRARKIEEFSSTLLDTGLRIAEAA